MKQTRTTAGESPPVNPLAGSAELVMGHSADLPRKALQEGEVDAAHGQVDRAMDIAGCEGAMERQAIEKGKVQDSEAHVARNSPP